MADGEEPGNGTVSIMGSRGNPGHLPQWITL